MVFLPSCLILILFASANLIKIIIKSYNKGQTDFELVQKDIPLEFYRKKNYLKGRVFRI